MESLAYSSKMYGCSNIICNVPSIPFRAIRDGIMTLKALVHIYLSMPLYTYILYLKKHRDQAAEIEYRLFIPMLNT